MAAQPPDCRSCTPAVPPAAPAMQLPLACAHEPLGKYQACAHVAGLVGKCLHPIIPALPLPAGVHNNLWANIDVGLGTRPFQSSGDTQRGSHAGQLAPVVCHTAALCSRQAIVVRLPCQ